jgi:hypothetical protein
MLQAGRWRPSAIILGTRRTRLRQGSLPRRSPLRRIPALTPRAPRAPPPQSGTDHMPPGHVLPGHATEHVPPGHGPEPPTGRDDRADLGLGSIGGADRAGRRLAPA